MNLLAALSRSLEELVARSSRAVVAVERPDGAGAGFVVGDMVVTNAHVVRGRGDVVIRETGGRPLPARVLGADPRTDVAVLTAPDMEADHLKFAEDPVRIGALVVAIGNPLRLDRSVSLGVVSALDRSLPAGRHRITGLLQHDAAINPGNSGGPLLGPDGEVVGVNTARVQRAEGLGFAVPATTARWIAEELRAHGRVRRRAIGVRARGVELGAREAARTGRDRGVRILEVRGGGAAGRSGLRAGDLVLDADAVAVCAVSDLERALSGTHPESTVRVLRDGRRVEIGLRLAG